MNAKTLFATPARSRGYTAADMATASPKGQAMTITELIAAEGCTPVADLTREQRAALLRLAQVELECYVEGDFMGAPVMLGMRTRYPVVIADRPGGGYLVFQKKPLPPYLP